MIRCRGLLNRAGSRRTGGFSGAKASTLAAMAENRLFLGVENSATGRAWRDRLDERGAARALAIAQRHDLPELLARILAGRNIEPDAVDAFLDPTIKHLMPDPLVLTAMKAAAERHRRRRRARRERRDLRRLRRRRRDLVGGAGALSAAMRPRAAHPYSRPPVRRLWPECRSGPRRSPSAARRCWSASIAAPPASSRSQRRRSSASMWSSSTTIRPTRRCRPRSPSSIRTGATIFRGSAISPRSGWFS